jgi:putative ABC transport system permease protein
MSDTRWYRALLRLLPLDFRSEYGAEMERTFHDQQREASGRLDAMRVWTGAVGSILADGPREHAVQLLQDIRYGLRGMRRNAGFAAVAVITLALGIGANTAVFGIVDAVLLRPLPYHDPDRVVAVWNRWDGSAAAALSNPEYLDYAEQSRLLKIAAVSAAGVNVGGAGGDPERVAAAHITSKVFDVIGVPVQHGRAFRIEEEADGAAPVAILSDRYWRRRFHADPSIVGSTIPVDGVATEIVGVAAAGGVLPFEIAGADNADVLLPQTLNRTAPRNRRSGHYLMAFARVQDGASIDAASAEMAGIIGRLSREYPDQHNQGNFAIVVRPLREDLLGDSRPVVLILFASVILVLLVACGNVANLMLARGEARRREMAVRTALGADRLRLIRQLLTESCMLSIAGAVAGLGVAWLLQQVIVAVGSSALPRLQDLQIRPSVLAFTAVVAVGVGVLFGLAPALQMARRSGVDLKAGDRGASDRSRVRQFLIVGQTATAIVLLVAAGLLVKSFVRLSHVPSGLQVDRVLSARLSLPESRYPDRPAITAFFSQLLTRVRALPGVRSAGAASGLPLSVNSGDWSFDIEGRGRVNGRRPGAADWFAVTPGYFESLGVPLRRGRLPTDSDTSAAPGVVFINEETARVVFPNADPIGQRIRLAQATGSEQPWRTIAGIVGDVRHRGLDTPPRTEMYIPYEQFLHFSAGAQARAMSLVIKTEREPAASASALRGAVRALDPDVPAAHIQEMSTIVAASVSNRRLNVMLIGAFGMLALTLTAVGLYGVMAFAVTQRRREIGVRIAMGATRSSVLTLVVGQAVRLVALGIAIGLAFSLLMAGSWSHMLFNVDPRDVSVYLAVPVLLLLTAALASYLPARRATRIDPVIALKADHTES